ncbi:hypothetical protein B6S12_07665 [Helicobacter valdiviensis]|uniref:Uncharacterized protein n=1 Tax=Helicobacter valdiviensis TaxID=1458358 RepID=A0A2W6NFK0_9HELI|nr:hypothetical protein [Helicobacter valdiviensis]PZT47730.1 hypothetical protein B6S12_07665 [Helicobacter valdiviensis]
MELCRKIEELNGLYANSIKILEEAKAQISQENVKEVLNNSFLQLEKETEKEIQLTTKTILEEKKEELKNANEEQVLELFLQNLQSLAQSIAPKVNLNEVVKLTTNELKEDNFQRLLEALSVVIEEEEFFSLLLNKKEEIKNKTEEFLTNLKKIDLHTHIYNHTQSFLDENKEEILGAQDLGFIKDFILKTKELREIIATHSRIATKEVINTKATKEVLIEVLKEDAIRVFEESLGLQELIEKRFLASNMLFSMSVQGEIKVIANTYNVLSDLILAQKRKEALEEIGTKEPIFKTYHVL